MKSGSGSKGTEGQGVPATEGPQALAHTGWAKAEQVAILVVEDDLHSREGLRDLLAWFGYRVETAADGIRAIRKITDGRFEGAIIDLDLPPVQGFVFNGWDVARICRAFTADVALVLVSAEGGAHVEARTRGLPRCEFIEKPIAPDRLRATLGRLGLAADRERGESDNRVRP